MKSHRFNRFATPSRLMLAAALTAAAGAVHAAPLKVDINNTGRQVSEGLDPAFTPWSDQQNWFAGGDTTSATFSGVTVALTRMGSVGAGLQTGYWKAGVQSTAYNVKLTGDGIKVDTGDAGAQIEMRISGLSTGTHTLLLYLNSWDNPATNTFAPLDILVNGTQVVDNLAVSGQVTDNNNATTSYLTVTATAGQDVVVLIKAETSGSQNLKNVYLNGFEIDTPNAKTQANAPVPANADEHVNADSGSVTLGWTTAFLGAASHNVYFGTSESAVTNATTASPEYKGNRTTNTYAAGGINPHLTYYWRVDEVASGGAVTKGNTWMFRPRRLAFPGAEGYGRFARGGRGGVVRHVTNLNDSGAGSLRDAIEGNYGVRTIVFDVSGLITLNDDIVIDGNMPYITVAGQTAPGKGICIKKQQLTISGGRDVIFRYMRLLVGKESGETQNATGMAGADHCIMDHVSAGWGIDEGLSTRNGKNLTFQRSSLSEALNVAGHQNYPAGTAHGYAASIGGAIGSFHHNLLAHNEGRNWSMAGGLDANGYYAGQLDIFNNVVYNWGGRTTDGGAHEVNFVNNYYKRGPANGITTILNPDYGGFPGTQQYYMAGNLLPGYVTESNQAAGLDIGTESGGTLPQNSNPPYSATVSSPFFPSYGTIDTAVNAYKKVLSDVGCNLPQIDTRDTRVINETLNGTYSVTGSVSGKKGLPDTTSDLGGWENYGTAARASDWDTDGDGMPDWWETIKGLNPNSTAGSFTESNADPDGDGYTNLEDYLNWMAAPHADCNAGSYVDVDLAALSVGYSKTTPTYTVSSPSGGTVAIISGNKARFTSSGGFNALGKFTYTVTDSAGDTMTRTIGVRVIGTGVGTGGAVIQAESGAVAGGTTIDSANSGWNGTGYANLPTTGGSLQFNGIDGGSGGSATLDIRFTVGGTTSRAGNLVVNGVTQAITFPSTTTWTNWTTMSVSIPLNPGTGNTIRFESTGQDLANIDEITVTPGVGPAIPASPSGLGATAGNAQVSLTWTASSGATSYNIKRSTTSGSGYTTVGTSTGASYTNTGLTNGTTYYYVVSAVNSGGESANSSQTSATPQPPAPSTPTGLAATAGNAQVALSWSAASGATSYNIKRSTTSGSGYTTVGTATGTSYTSTSLTNGTTYYYVVTAVNGGGESANSSQSSATPQPPAPAVPTGVAATAGDTQVFLSWSASSGATSYNVKRSTTSGSGYATVGTATGTSFTSTSLSNGTTYYYVVTAVNGGGESANSSQSSATPQPPAPSAPAGLAATAGNGQAALTWGASSGATSYNIKRSTTSGSGYANVGTATGTSYTNTGLTNGTTYYYVVSAVNGGGESADSSQVGATPTAPVLTGLLAYEGFNYSAAATLATQSGGYGWGANWSPANPQDVSATQAASLVSGGLLTSGGSMKLGPSSAGGSGSSGVHMRQLANTLGTLAAGGNGTLWLSLFYQNSTSGADASGYYGESRIGLYSGVTASGGSTVTGGATNVLNTGTPTTSATVLDRVSLYLGSTVNATGVATPRSTTPAHLLLKIVADNTTATDTVYLWVNPNLAAGEPANNTAHATWTAADVSGVNGLRFQQTGSNGGVVATIDEIRLGRTFGDVTASSALPSPWATADVGSVAAAGNAGHSTGVFTVTGSGSGIAGTADEFRSVHQSGSGDCAVTARVSTLSSGKAGVSIRESAASNAIQASCLVANGSVSFVYRTSTGGAITTVPVSGVNPPRWVKIERAGDAFTASHSADGLSWSTVGSATIPMASATALGTVVTSEADGTLATGTIDQVIATP